MLLNQALRTCRFLSNSILQVALFSMICLSCNFTLLIQIASKHILIESFSFLFTIYTRVLLYYILAKNPIKTLKANFCLLKSLTTSLLFFSHNILAKTRYLTPRSTILLTVLILNAISLSAFSSLEFFLSIFEHNFFNLLW